MELHWRPEDADAVEAISAQSKARGEMKRVLAILGVFVVVLPIIGLATDDHSLIVGAFGGVVIGLVIIPLRPVFSRMISRRNPAHGLPITAQVSESGVTIHNGLGSNMWSWQAFGGFLETPRVFVLMPVGTKLSLVLLAKRGLQDPSDDPALRQLLTERIRPPAVASRRRVGVAY